ncbi:MAG: shikimate dehydrogenase [Oscillospiraceae bacterium]|nr:shikimate dehydrogenase [Oscillospiraceae bacterium]
MKLYGLLGEKLGHSLSPQIHKIIFDSMGIDGQYALIEVSRENISKAVDALKVLGYSGVNVTIPYKELIMPYLDEISPEAKAIGAVNVIHFVDGKAVGYNSDYYGFSKMLELAGIEVKGKRAVQLGAGGAAKACVAALHDMGAESILVANRSSDKLDELKGRFSYIETCIINETEKLVGDVLVNCTPVGMYPKSDGCPVTQDVISRFEAVGDVIYNPLETVLTGTAKKLGLKATSGLNMLVYQAVKAQEIWQQTTIDEALGEKIYQELAKNF